MLKRVCNKGESESENPKKSRRVERLLWLLSMIFLSAAVLLLYRFFLTSSVFPWVLGTYMVVFTLFLLAYVIYNRGFSRRNVTVEMLPDEWSEEKKEAFLADGRERMRKSKWMLLPIVAFGFTFAYDMIELFVIPYFRTMFS